MNWTSKYCYHHVPVKYTENNTTADEWQSLKMKFAVQMILKNGKEICPRCELEAEIMREDEQFRSELTKRLKREKYEILASRSLVPDESIKLARFDNYHEIGEEERLNKQRALHLVEHLKQGKQYNIWIQSSITGVGKSHLAMSMLKELNSLQVSCLFLDIDEMLRKIRGSFNDKESPYTEQYFIDLATKVDFLVLDDLGAETGDIDTNKRASDYTSRILRAIQNGRQLKSTIITTNLTSNRLKDIYDPKVISRLMKNIVSITFEKANDKRIKNIGF